MVKFNFEWYFNLIFKILKSILLSGLGEELGSK